MNLRQRLFRASIWYPDAIPVDEWKTRNQKRVWWPLYDGIVMAMGLWAIGFGSPLMHRLFTNTIIDIAGGTLFLAGVVCSLGVAFPRLWRMELIGKSVVFTLLVVYAGLVGIFSVYPAYENGFVVLGLVLMCLPALMRLDLLGEEIKERRDEAKKAEETTDAE